MIRRLASRKIFLRLHNIEYVYYRQLRRSATSFFKRIYYNFESKLLKKYEYKIARKFSGIFTVSQLDRFNYKKKMHIRNCIFVPVFTGHSVVHSPKRREKADIAYIMAIYQLPENEKAVFWLIDKVFCHLDIKLIIAGRKCLSSFTQKNKFIF